MEVYTGDQERSIVGLYISEEEKGYIDELLFVLRSGAKREAWNVVNHTKMFMSTSNKHGINFLKDIAERENTNTGRAPGISNPRSKDPYDWYMDPKHIQNVIQHNERMIQLWEDALTNGCLRGRNKGKPLAETTRKNYERDIRRSKWVIERLREKLNDIQRPASPVLRLVS